MSDLICRQAAIDAVMECYDNDELFEVYEWKLNELPPIQPKRGKWIRDGHHIRCDQCGIYMCDTDREGDRIPTDFCPSCGSYNGGET